MSTPTETTKEAVAETSFAEDLVTFARYRLRRAANWARPYLGGRRGLLLLAVAVLGGAMVFNWGWLVAIGLAPILVALAPCALMCAAGFCMSRAGGKSCSGGEQSSDASADRSASTKPREDA